MKLATWNVNSLAVRLPQLLDWLNAHQPDGSATARAFGFSLNQ